jgi:hypothetical protein
MTPKSVGFEKWDEVLSKIKDGKHAVYGPLRLAKASAEGNTIRIGLSFPFHIKRVNETANLSVVVSTINEVTKGDYQVEVYRVEQGDATSDVDIQKSVLPEVDISTDNDDISLMSDPLSMVKNVFGDAQVL